MSDIRQFVREYTDEQIVRFERIARLSIENARQTEEEIIALEAQYSHCLSLNWTSDTRNKDVEIGDWMRENIKGKWKSCPLYDNYAVAHVIIGFEDISDAVHFKLKWF